MGETWRVAPLLPPVKFGFSSAPLLPQLVAVTTTIDLPAIQPLFFSAPAWFGQGPRDPLARLWSMFRELVITAAVAGAALTVAPSATADPPTPETCPEWRTGST